MAGRDGGLLREHEHSCVGIARRISTDRTTGEQLRAQRRIRFQRERGVGVTQDCAVIVTRHRLARGFGQRGQGGRAQMTDVVPERGLELERGRVVVSDELGRLRAIGSDTLEPRRGALMALGPRRARELRIRDLPDQGVREGKLDLACDTGPSRAPHELLAFEAEEQVVGFETVPFTERAHGTQPHRRTKDGGVLEHALLGRRKAVEPGRDDALHRLGKCGVRTPFDQRTYVFLRVQRVTTGSFQQHCLDIDREQRSIDDPADERGRVTRGERAEPDRQRVALTCCPIGPALEQLRTSGRHDEERYVVDASDESVDEVEQCVVGPVQILDYDDGC